MPSILIVDDEAGMRKSLAILFNKGGYHVFQADSAESAIGLVGSKNIDLVITDLRLNGMSGTDLLKNIREKSLRVPVIIMTAYGTIDSAVLAMKMGAYDYITKPFEYEEVLHRVRKAIEMAETDHEMGTMLRTKITHKDKDFSMIIGESNIIRDIKTQLRKISDSDFPVLITGETGTGKNLLAKAIHLNSSKATDPFINVNCTSIPEHLLESELFGHTKGAFTGAIMERKGLFEVANRGTLLLDEIGAIPRTIQAKLLGVLQDGVIRKVGSNDEIPIGVRIIAATNVNILSAIKNGEFREDLYYRINVLHIHVPPLRTHKEDIPALAENFLSFCKAKQNKPHIVGFTPEVIDKLYYYDYPGNVRELFNIVCHSVVASNSSMIYCEDLPKLIMQVPETVAATTGEMVPISIEEWEKRMIIQSIKRHPHNLTKVCNELKIGRTTLWRKMKQHGIDAQRLR